MAAFPRHDILAEVGTELLDHPGHYVGLSGKAAPQATFAVTVNGKDAVDGAC